MWRASGTLNHFNPDHFRAHVSAYVLSIMIIACALSPSIVYSSMLAPLGKLKSDKSFAAPATESNATRGLGCLPETIPDRSRAKLTAAAGEGLLTQVDWRSRSGYNWITSIKNQGSCGSCAAFGSVGAFEAVIRIAYNNPSLSVNLSEQHLFSCGGGSCTNGWTISSALNYMRDSGVPDESCLPYSAVDNNCGSSCSNWQSRAYRISSWSWLTTDYASIETALQNGPVVARFDVYEDFYGCKLGHPDCGYSGYTGGIYIHTGGLYVGGHCITIVGYDSTQQYWICKNSWGSSWGESGYFRIGFGQCGIEQYVASITYSPIVGVRWSMLDGPSPDAPALASSSSRLYLAARDSNYRIWYRSMDSSRSWSGWTSIPGFTDVRPAIAVFNNRLYFFCKQKGANNIWFGSYPLSGGVVSGSFSGWVPLDGLTSSPVSLAVAPDYLYVAVRSTDSSIWHRRMSTGEAWSSWVWIPGYTDVAPAVAIFNSRLYFACKQSGVSTIWYSYVTVLTYPSGWSGWTRLDGPTPDAVSLTASSNYLYLAARGADDGIWYRTMDLSGVWSTWTGSLGLTDVSPAIATAIFDGNQYLVCKGKGSTTIWYRVA